MGPFKFRPLNEVKDVPVESVKPADSEVRTEPWPDGQPTFRPLGGSEGRDITQMETARISEQPQQTSGSISFQLKYRLETALKAATAYAKAPHNQTFRQVHQAVAALATVSHDLNGNAAAPNGENPAITQARVRGGLATPVGVGESVVAALTDSRINPERAAKEALETGGPGFSNDYLTQLALVADAALAELAAVAAVHHRNAGIESVGNIEPAGIE